MNCYYHPTEPAVVQCKSCGRGFCKDCSTGVINGICTDCRRELEQASNQSKTNTEQNRIKDKQKWHLTGILWMAAGIIGSFVYMMSSTSIEDSENTGFIIFILGIVVFLFRYAKRLVYAILSKMAGRGGCLINATILFILNIFVVIILSPIAPLLLLYSILRVCGLKKGLSDYVTWIDL